MCRFGQRPEPELLKLEYILKRRKACLDDTGGWIRTREVRVRREEGRKCEVRGARRTIDGSAESRIAPPVLPAKRRSGYSTRRRQYIVVGRGRVRGTRRAKISRGRPRISPERIKNEDESVWRKKTSLPSPGEYKSKAGYTYKYTGNVRLRQENGSRKASDGRTANSGN